MHSSFIGPRTEIGQKIHNIYKSKLLELAKDKELFLSVEQLLVESTELEQKYGSDIQSENSNNEKKIGRLDPKNYDYSNKKTKLQMTNPQQRMIHNLKIAIKSQSNLIQKPLYHRDY